MTATTESLVQRLERRTAFWLASFTAFGGGALGIVSDIIPGIEDSHGSAAVARCLLDTDCPNTPRDTALRVWVAVVLLAIAVVAAVQGWRSWRRRNRLLTERGTVYVVYSPEKHWTPDEKTAFLNSAAAEAADVLKVPGPTGLTSWLWPLDDEAKRWSDAVDDLVLSFRSVWANDDRSTPDSVVCWAPFPVSIAWTARALKAERSLQLAVRQRPSTGRAGRIDVPDWNQTVHTFDPPAANPSLGTTRTVRDARIELTHGDHDPTPGAPLRVLLVRFHRGAWDDVPLDGDEPVHLRIADRSGQPLRLAANAEFHEWRYLLAPGRLHPWETYPSLVSEICDWIAQTAHGTGPNLIGMLAPPEVVLGVGVNVSRRTRDEWPAHLWPLVKPTDAHVLTVPGLDLGYESLHRAHRDGPR